ncbi:MAG TPA: hypothetical protein PK482_09180 [Spirochaetota bacterium]|nr:hypothetical protein [Spirochaetota bacterium]
MKKFLVVLSALLIATGAFAQDAKKADFNYSFFGIAYGVMGSQDKMEYDYSHIRVRPFFTVGNENVKGVVRLEIDQDYGKTDTTADSDLVPGVKQNDGADKGTDNKVVEVKWAYLQVKDFLIPNLTATMGLNAYYFPMVVDNDFAMNQLAYDFGMGKAIFSYIKIDEYDVVEKTAADVKQNKDAQAYAIDLPIKAGAINVRPGFLYITSGKEAKLLFYDDDESKTYDAGDDIELSKAKLYNAALNVNGDFGMVGLDLTGAYLWGNVTETTAGKIDVAAYAFDALLTVKPAEGISLGLFATYTSGQDDGDKFKGYDIIMETYMGACDGRLFLIEAAGVASNGGYQPFDQTDTFAGLMVYGVNLEATFGKLALLAQYGYASVADDTSTGDSFIGHEFDLKAAYTVAPATTFFVEGGYIKAGDIITDDAWEVAYGLTTKI